MRELQKKHEGGEFIYHRCFDTLSLSLSLSLYLLCGEYISLVRRFLLLRHLSLFFSFLPSLLSLERRRRKRGFDAFDFSVDEMMILDDDDGSFFSLSLSFNALVSSFCAEKIISQ